MALIVTLIVMSLIPESVQGITQVHFFNTSTTIQSKNYPKPYPPGSNCSWVGQASSGVWGINFLDVDLSGGDGDYIIVYRSNKQINYVYNMHTRLYTSNPSVTISFHSEHMTNTKGRGFRIDVVHGKNKYDLDQHFSSVTPPPYLNNNQEMTTAVTLVLLAIATIVLFLVLGMFLWYRRRHVEQVVSLNVNIRRDSGVRYTRQNSSQCQEPPSSPVRKNNPIVRTLSNRSWAVRAELTSTTRTCQRDDNQQSTVPNVYAPMADLPNLTGKSVSQKMPVCGNEHVTVTGRVAMTGGDVRVRCPTLSRVLENSLSMTVPVAAGSSPHDDGYVAPGPKCSPAFTAPDDGYIAPSCLQSVSVACDDAYITPVPIYFT